MRAVLASALALLALAGCSGNASREVLHWEHSYGGTTSVNGRTSYTGHSETESADLSCRSTGQLDASVSQMRRGEAHIVLRDGAGEVAATATLDAETLSAQQALLGKAGTWHLELRLEDFNGKIVLSITC